MRSSRAELQVHPRASFACRARVTTRRFLQIGRGVRSNDLVPRLAENDANARLVFRAPQNVINRGEVEVRLAAVLRLKAEVQEIEQEIDSKLLTPPEPDTDCPRSDARSWAARTRSFGLLRTM